jgi:hypothetical protein
MLQARASAGAGHGDAEPDDEQRAEEEPEREQHHRPRPANDAGQLEPDQRKLHDVEHPADLETPSNRHARARHAPSISRGTAPGIPGSPGFLADLRQ